MTNLHGLIDALVLGHEGKALGWQTANFGGNVFRSVVGEVVVFLIYFVILLFELGHVI